MSRALRYTLLACILPQLVSSQLAKSYKLNTTPIDFQPQSNSVNDILVQRDSLWLGTEKGLDLTADRGITWRHFANTATFDNKGISAIAINDEILWVSTASSFKQDDQTLPSGGGLHYSTNRGATWTYIAQPTDRGTVDTIQYGVNKIRTLAVTTTVNNLTYDLALTRSAVWAANFAGMLRKSTDRGITWQKVVLPPDVGPTSIKPTDTLDFDLAPVGGSSDSLRGNLNHRVFSVFASNDSTIWVGTAGGINKSTDGGISWRRYSHQNQAQAISGNFVVGINEQRWGAKTIVWAATVNAESSDEARGVSYSDDGGSTWKTTLLGEFAHNIAFKDSIVYVATDEGLFRSNDFGNSWTKSGTIYDPQTLQRFTSAAVFAVRSMGDTIWVGGPEGVAYTLDNPTQPFGFAWKLFRTSVQVGSSDATYSYPSPFSPDDEVVRIHYRTQPTPNPLVTIRIFDFAMQPVRTLLQKASRQGSTEYDEIWDGRDENRRRVANGVYFYRLELEGRDPLWGKIFVVN